MGFQIALVVRTPLVTGGGTPGPIRPYYGVADAGVAKTAAFITSLTGRGPTAGSRLATSISINANGNNSGFYCYPVAYGEAQFMELDANGNIIGLGYGGWDGAGGDPISIYGPIIIPNVVAEGQPAQDYYVYQTDWPGIGQTYWQVS